MQFFNIKILQSVKLFISTAKSLVINKIIIIYILSSVSTTGLFLFCILDCRGITW